MLRKQQAEIAMLSQRLQRYEDNFRKSSGMLLLPPSPSHLPPSHGSTAHESRALSSSEEEQAFVDSPRQRKEERERREERERKEERERRREGEKREERERRGGIPVKREKRDEKPVRSIIVPPSGIPPPRRDSGAAMQARTSSSSSQALNSFLAESCWLHQHKPVEEVGILACNPASSTTASHIEYVQVKTEETESD
eukprot:768805-Hanusia_phi.AAC.13